MDAPTPHLPVPARHEILEERGNRDAFRLCVLILIVAAIALVVVGIVAWNSRFMVMSLPARPPEKAAAEKSQFLYLQGGSTDSGTFTASFVDRLRLAPTSDAPRTRQSCRSAVNLPRVLLGSTRESHVSPARTMPTSDRATAALSVSQPSAFNSQLARA